MTISSEDPEANGEDSAPNEVDPGRVTGWLIEWTKGDRDALDRLIPLVYGELRRLARGYLGRRKQPGPLQPTALINEVFLRLIDREKIDWKNRAHFFGVAAKTMRGILVDQARRELAAKRGGGAMMLSFDETIQVSGLERDVELVSLDDALNGLATVDAGLSELVELRFFGGLTIEETAEVQGVSAGTVKRGWKTAQSWLRREMTRGEAAP